jgi:hypothetical protein
MREIMQVLCIILKYGMIDVGSQSLLVREGWMGRGRGGASCRTISHNARLRKVRDIVGIEALRVRNVEGEDVAWGLPQ